MPKVLGYIRQSRDKDQQKHSEAYQFDLAMRYHEGQKIIRGSAWPQEIKWFRDIDVSGRLYPMLLERQGGRELMKEAQRGDKLLVHRMDRIGRNSAEIKQAIMWFDAHGVAVHILDRGGEALDTSTALGRFFVGLLAELAELEVGKTIERTKDTLDSLKRRGERYNFRPGHGNKFVERDGKTFIEPDLELRVAIDKAMDMHAEGYPYHVIAAYFELNGPKPPAHFAPRWTGKNIGNLLRKERKIRSMRQVA